LSALGETAAERQREIAELWPEDESPQTASLREERLAALHHELRHDAGALLASQR
jgi:hypothetical protein